ncbi:GDSL-type esterase/lipase family protein [Sunxiuqinia indica]|uniref:GDSL-type esterase/lipase family protein n=1 Tax=Sunxiuqinia indica TaxID=2692584 RepID=UPI0013576DC3|nr:GDSL-type esterase/lipase family protein [Sunxiuqinia indica]
MKRHFFKISLVLITTILIAGNIAFAQYDPEVKWGESIAKYEKKDSVSMPEPGGILMLGSSSFTIWQDVGDYFPGKNMVNRGFGGSEMSDVLFFKERLILPYQPKQIILYEGENDIAAGEKPDSIFAELLQLVEWTRVQIPGVQISLVSMKPSPKRWELKETMLVMNRKLKQFAAENEDIDFINIWDPLLEPDGVPENENYREDLLHLNAKGYKIWQKAMSPYLK